jgi:hypothetical protein
MSAAPKSTTPREAVVVPLAGSRTWIAKVKVDVVEEELDIDDAEPRWALAAR